MGEETRRDFLCSLTVGLAAAAAYPAAPRPGDGSVQTVLGPVAVDALGITLIHEHVLVDFIGAAKAGKERYNPDEVFQTVLPHLKKIRESGCSSMAECTPAFLGRDPLLLRKLSEASQIHLITNTGYYGAAGQKYLPPQAFTEGAEQLARRWIKESEAGIESSRIKPGFIKIGVNKGPLPEVDRKLVRAAALAHKATGLTIASHTGDGPAAEEQIRILKEEGVHPSSFIWVHAQNEPDAEIHTRLAAEGAWLEFEGFGSPNLQPQAAKIKSLVDRGHIDRILISLDAGWYHVGEAGGGQFRSYSAFFSDVLPALAETGISKAQIRTLNLENPRTALNPKPRLL